MRPETIAKHITLGVVGEPLEHVVEVSRLLARGNGGAVDFGEHFREFGETVGEGVALHDAGPYAEDDALHAGLFGLLRDREQRLLERQTGTHQRRELTGEERQIARRHASREAERLLARRLLLRHLVDGDGQQLPFAQQLADVAGCIAFQYAGAFLAPGIQCCVFECAHRQLSLANGMLLA
jgi:hypothetical protein